MSLPPGRINLAWTTPCVAVLPKPPIHHLVLVKVGEFISNSRVSGIYVAVVSRRFTLVPCASSVCK